MKKDYHTPEFDYVKLTTCSVICTSAETPIGDIFESEDDDDV